MKLSEKPNLVEILKKETESLKTQYIEMCEKWAASKYESYKSDKRIIFYERNNFYGKCNFGKTKAEDSELNRMVSILNKGLEKYLNEVKQDAIDHYESSVLKLANRIETKGLLVEKLKVETSHIGVNIDTTLTDGVKTVRAFTIIASGEIQKPHYRYLIK